MYRILEALATKPKIPKNLDKRLMLRSFSRKFQPKTDLGLRFEVVQSFRLVWTKQTVTYHLHFTAFKSCAFYIRAFFYKIQTVHFSGALTWLTSGGSRGGARGACPPLFFDQNEARRAEKNFLETGPPPTPPYLRVWMTGPPPYLKVWIRHYLHATVMW